MKECNKCNLVKEEKEFHKRKNGKCYSECKECHRLYLKNHYQNNKKYYIEKANRNWLKVKTWFEEYRATLKCNNCPENHPATLDFHHIDPTKKDESIAVLVKMGCKQKILKEIEKCEVLCSNCHRKLHWEEKQILNS